MTFSASWHPALEYGDACDQYLDYEGGFGPHEYPPPDVDGSNPANDNPSEPNVNAILTPETASLQRRHGSQAKSSPESALWEGYRDEDGKAQFPSKAMYSSMDIDVASWSQPCTWTDTNSEATRAIKEDDSQSLCSSCSDSCDSDCGEDGQGPVCCHDEDCGPHDVGELCLDGTCGAAGDPCTAQSCETQGVQGLCFDGFCDGLGDACTHQGCQTTIRGVQDPCPDGSCKVSVEPCTDAGCFGEAVIPAPAPAPHGAGIRPEDAEKAAEALASFVYMGDASDQMYSFPTASETTKFDSNSFTLGTDNPGSGHDTSGLGYMAEDTSSTPDFLGSGSYTNKWPSGQQGPSTYLPKQEPFGIKMFSHIRDHHLNPQAESGHIRPCMADNPSFAGARCPLPSTDFGHTGDISSISQGQFTPEQCGFTAPTPSLFVDHITTQHGDMLSKMPDFSDPMYWGFGSSEGVSVCEQTNTQAISNGVQYPPTPATGTSSCDSNTSHRSQEQMPVKTSSVNQCFWADPETGTPCLREFETSDELDVHCRQSHVGKMAKIDGGFRCMWQGCRRHEPIFHTRAKLNRHMQTHTGFKPLQCHICGMKLSAKQALDQHLRTHTNEHPFKCHIEGCGKSFKQQSALTMHIRTHTKEKPLKCEECGAVFTESSNLSKHRRTHAKFGIFTCEICRKDFHRLDQLRRHIKSNHRDCRPDMIDDAIERAKATRKKVTHTKRAEMKCTPALPDIQSVQQADSVVPIFV